jgi:CBS domain-containing protein
MKVASILKVKTARVVTTPPGTSVATSARKLRDEDIGALVVSDDGATVLGLITERDIVHGDEPHDPAADTPPSRRGRWRAAGHRQHR